MAGYSKLFSSIVTSSVWCEDSATLRVWIAMLATKDTNGNVEGSIPGFANLARVTIQEMTKAIETLSSPDPFSRSKESEGRRIEEIPGGWHVINHDKYRNMCQSQDGSRAPYMRDYREKNGGSWPTPKKRRAIMDRFGWACVKCGSDDGLEIDHITPKSRGGTDDDDNLQVLCKSCNLAKRVNDGNVRGNKAV